MRKKVVVICILIVFSTAAFAQKDSALYFKGAVKEKRDQLQRSIIKSIAKNLSLALNDDTEENWVDAFGGMELVQYKPLWAETRVRLAFDSVEKRSAYFQRALLEFAYTIYPGRFIKEVMLLLYQTGDAKIFAMAAEYLGLKNARVLHGIDFENKKQQLVKNEKDEAVMSQLDCRINNRQDGKGAIPLSTLADYNFLKGHVILYSLQRRNRNYPGLAVIRDTAGHFVKDRDGAIFSVPQLARSINNLPGYLTNGNTPQGIFRMYGFDTSKTYFIGPTTNIQLTMPFETNLQHFFNDSTITDSVWTEGWYKKLLPANLKNNQSIFESFYAGKAGRTEIIAHGTTVDPEYYKGEKFYPQTPTMGCLCTKETWSGIDGKRIESDQQKLAAAVKLAGGPDGYCVVIEINDDPKPVGPDEILFLLNPATAK